MSTNSFSTSFTVDRSPDEVFAAITAVRSWWEGDIDGPTDRLGEEFTYRYEQLHFSRQWVTELVPGRRVAWLVVEALLSFAQDGAEWTGTEITFDLSPTDTGTEVRFTHHGLVPAFECFADCSNAWGYYVNGRLRNLLTTGSAASSRLGA